MKYIASLFLVLLWSSFAFAQIIAVKPHTAELRNSIDPYAYRVILKVPRYYPLSIESEKGDYYQVRDFLGRSGWIAKKDTYPQETVVINSEGKKVTRKMRAVVVKSKSINVRSGPGTNNRIVLKASQGVAFKVLSQDGEWLEVLHDTGEQGWVHSNLVWGG